MRTFFISSALCFLAACRAQAPAPAASSTHAPGSSDHAVYTAVLREHFLRPNPGNEPVFCRSEAPDLLQIVGTTQPLPPGTPRRDAGWADHLPAQAAPLLASLRAMDNQPGRALDRDGLDVGVPIRLVPHSVAARALEPTDPPATEPGPPLSWFSRVAYTADGNWALVYAVEACTGVTEAMAAEAEGWAYDTVMLAPLERRAGVWTVHDPLYLDVGLPRLEPPD